MDDTSPVARLSIEIQEERIEQGAIEVLSQIRPKWTASDIQFKVFFPHILICVTLYTIR